MGVDDGGYGEVRIGVYPGEVVIKINRNGKYESMSRSGKKKLKITKDGEINAITKAGHKEWVEINILEVYAQL